MATQKKQSVLNGAMMLMLGVVLVKIIGAMFKMPLTDILGLEGRGYFNSAYEIYTPVFAISMAGLPVAVSKMVAENVALNRFKDARRIFNVSKIVFLIVGLAGTAVLLLAALPYSHFIETENASINTFVELIKTLIGSPQLLADLPKTFAAVLCVAPSVFFCCYMSAYRGYYEGLRNMTPTAISQVIEALGKLIIGIALAKVVISIGDAQYVEGMLASGNASATVFGIKVFDETSKNGIVLSFAAAGAVLGVTTGSILSNLFLIIRHKIKGDGFDRVQLVNSPQPETSGKLAKTMIKIAVPMVVSALVLNITNLVDTVTIQSRLMSALGEGFDTIQNMYSDVFDKAVELNRIDLSDMKRVRSYLWGAYGAAQDFRNLVPTITIQLGVSALPALAAAWATKDKSSIKSTVETVIRISMLVALPAGIGMAVLSPDLLTILYGRGGSSEAIPIIAPVLTAFGIATPLMAVSTPVNNLLQAIGRTDIPVKSVIVGALTKVICNFVLVGIPKINIYGAVVGTVMFYVVIVAFNFISLLRITKVKVRWGSIFGKPFVCAVLCGVTAFVTNSLLNRFIPAIAGKLVSVVGANDILVRLASGDTTESILNAGTISTLIAIALAAVVYGITLLLIKGLAREDVSVLPKGEKIAKTLEKYGLLG